MLTPTATSRGVRLLRLLRLALHLARGLAIAAFVFPRITEADRREHVRRWSRTVLDILAIRLHVAPAGAAPAPAAGGTMLVANHVSWVDIFAINAVMPARFVAKSEVAAWPVAGWLATRAGTLYVKRARRHDTARVNRDMGAALQGGERVAVFPEGTTTDGTRLLKFHSSLLEPAVAAAAALLPVALAYRRPDGSVCTELAYDAHWTLWDTLRRMVRVPHIDCHLTVLPVMAPGEPRRTLAARAHVAIAAALDLPAVTHTRTETPDGPRVAAR